MGLSRIQFAFRFQEIVEFAGLWKYIDIPVKYYSSGMQARLAFSVALCVQPDILLLDEVLAVGDKGVPGKVSKPLAHVPLRRRHDGDRFA